MSEAVREATFDEQITNTIMHILALELPMCLRRDLIGQVLALSYRHERDLFDASRGRTE